jgi:ATP synthase I chain
LIDRPKLDATPLLRETLLLSSVATLVCCALVSVLGDPRLALTIALGAVIAVANFLLLARWIGRAIDRTVADPRDTPERPRSGLRLAFLLLAMLGVLWYMPARPEGMAVGVLIVLVAATIAGNRHNRAI